MISEQIEINDHQINMVAYGPPVGQVVVLLHHGLGSIRSWDAQVHALAAAGYRVLAYDRWGYGGSDPRPQLSAPLFADDIQDLRALIAHLGTTGVGLVGHSDGGTIALYYAARYPEQVDSLVTVAAHIYVEVKMTHGIEGVRQAYESESRLRESRLRAGMRRLHGEKTEDVFWNWYHGWTKAENLAWDMRPTLGRVTCPALVVQGENDEHAAPQHAMEIAAAISGSELWLVPGAGHMLPQEQPLLFNQRVLDFIKLVYRESVNVQ